MNTQRINLNFGIILFLIVLAALSRIVPHMYGFSPLGSIALFGAAMFMNRKWAFIIPVAATLLSDLFLNKLLYSQVDSVGYLFYDGFYWQYIAYILIVIVGLGIFKKVTAGRVVAGALTSTVLFFIISNFGTWVSTNFYPKTMSGLMTCYTAGLPFLKGGFLGDLFYSTALFGSYFLLTKKLLKPSLVKS